MDEFNTKEKVEELCKSVDGLGENNCIFLCFIDTNREGLKYGAKVDLYITKIDYDKKKVKVVLL